MVIYTVLWDQFNFPKYQKVRILKHCPNWESIYF
jgi:hypothetical protein